MNTTAKTINEKLKKTLQYLLNFLFPKEISVQEIETLSLAEFMSRAPRGNNPSRMIISCFTYRNQLIEKSIWEVKYRKNEKIAELLAAAAAEILTDELSERSQMDNFTEPLLVPIPASRHRLSEQGYNQCELLARAISKAMNASIPVMLALTKVRETATQTSVTSKKARRENIQHTFAVKNSSAVAGRNIIILDDVTTTGSTILEAKRVLIAAGALKIIALTIAH